MHERKPSLLLTDLYELTMSAAFFENHFNPTASFELSVRRLPKNRGYLMVAGLEQALSWLQSARFNGDDIDFLRKQSPFQHLKGSFFEYLRDLKFTGEIWAVPEGTAMFAEEPMVRVTAPMIEAQIVETYLLTTITFQTMVATKASRIVAAAQGRDVIEFGARRAHGPGAAILAARAAYIGGCVGTSNVEAGYKYGIPTFGTMAHSFVMALEDEISAFQQYVDLFPETSVLLIDTYDTLAAADHIVASGIHPTGVRLDSGNLGELAREVRRRFDGGGLHNTKILLSSDLDEYKVADLVSQGVPVDGFGIGTALVVSEDAPSLSGIYKLVEADKDGKKSYHAKFSSEKTTYPGTKQVHRFRHDNGMFAGDLITCAGEQVREGEALLRQVMRDGERTGQPAETLGTIRQRAQRQLESLPSTVRRLTDPQQYEVKFSSELDRLQRAVQQRHLR